MEFGCLWLQIAKAPVRLRSYAFSAEPLLHTQSMDVDEDLDASDLDLMFFPNRCDTALRSHFPAYQKFNGYSKELVTVPTISFISGSRFF